MRLVKGQEYDVRDTYQMSTAKFRLIGMVDKFMDGRSVEKFKTFLLQRADGDVKAYPLCLAILDCHFHSNTGEVEVFFQAVKYGYSMSSMNSVNVTEYKLIEANMAT